LDYGTVYSFKIEARNLNGYSLYSETVEILCAAVPAKPDAPTTSIVNDEVILDWDEPADNGMPLTGYFVYIRQSDLSYIIDLSVCDGQGFEVMLSTQCAVALKTLQGEPFNLNVGYSIYIKILAQNEYGDSEISEPGNGAVMVSVPDPPFLVMNDVTVTSDSKIGFYWFDGATNGGAVIEDYRIRWDQSIGFWVTLDEGLTDRIY
jgi:hypothetical protein